MLTEDDAARKRARTRRHFRRLVYIMTFIGAAAALLTLVYLRIAAVPMPWQARVAIGGGVFLSMVVAGLLMGLVFSSARSGHDEAVADRDFEE